MVDNSGGAESTTNRLEQTNYAEALWVMEGAYKGLNELYPERFDENGLPAQQCVDNSGTTLYGAEACESVIADYTLTIVDPSPCGTAEECAENISCFAGNEGDGAAQDTEELCDLVSLKYGLLQW